MEKKWYIYILRCKDGTLYTGITDDVPARLQTHREGKGAKYTRGRGPLELVYTEVAENRSAASRREWQIKHLKKHEKMALCHNWLQRAYDNRGDETQ